MAKLGKLYIRDKCPDRFVIMPKNYPRNRVENRQSWRQTQHWCKCNTRHSGRDSLKAECAMVYEIRVSNIPYGAYTEWYLGTDVCIFASRKEAEEIVRQFEISRDEHPEDFEPGMEAEIIGWPDDDLNEDDEDEYGGGEE